MVFLSGLFMRFSPKPHPRAIANRPSLGCRPFRSFSHRVWIALDAESLGADYSHRTRKVNASAFGAVKESMR